MNFVTNPAFGTWDMDSIGEVFEPEARDGVMGAAKGLGGDWCPSCKEDGVYHWLDNPKLGCRRCGTHLSDILMLVDLSKGTMTYKEEKRIKEHYECRKRLNKV